MSQHDYVVGNDTGAAVRADLNNVLAAIVSQNSGATAPSSTFAYQFWADTTAGLLKIRNAANSAWVTVGTLATSYLGNMQTTGGTFSGAIDFSNTDYMKIPVGTTAQRPVSPAAGHIRYNSDLKSMEIYEDAVWIQIGDRIALATKTSAYTLVNSDDTILGDCTSASFTLTLPTAVGITGKRFTIKKINTANTLTIATTSSQTIDGATSEALYGSTGCLVVQSDGANWILISLQDFRAFTPTLTVASGGGSTSSPAANWFRNGKLRTLHAKYSFSGMSGTVQITFPVSECPDGGPTNDYDSAGVQRRSNSSGAAGTMGKFSTNIQMICTTTEFGGSGDAVGFMHYYK